jgi:hypothetical protein
MLYPAELGGRTEGKILYSKGNPASTPPCGNFKFTPKKPVFCTGAAKYLFGDKNHITHYDARIFLEKTDMNWKYDQSLSRYGDVWNAGGYEGKRVEIIFGVLNKHVSSKLGRTRRGGGMRMDSRIPHVPDVILAIFLTFVIAFTMIVVIVNVARIIAWVQGLPFDG